MKKFLLSVLVFAFAFNTGSSLFAHNSMSMDDIRSWTDRQKERSRDLTRAIAGWTQKQKDHGVLMVKRAFGYAPCSPAEKAEAQKWVGKVSAAVIGALIIIGGLAGAGMYAMKKRADLMKFKHKDFNRTEGSEILEHGGKFYSVVYSTNRKGVPIWIHNYSKLGQSIGENAEYITAISETKNPNKK